MTDNFDAGRYNPDTKQEILDALITDAESQAAFGTEFDPDEVAIIRAHYDPIAEQLARLQEDIKIVLDSSQIDHAEGTALDLLAAWIGVSRDPAKKATGRVRFGRNERATQDYSVPSSTEVQTDENDPVIFETDNSNTLGILDDFEDQDIAEYSGDTADFSITSTTVVEGSYALEAAAVSGSKIYRTDETFGSDSQVHLRMNVGSTSEAAFLFGLQDSSNFYEARVDNANGQLEIGKVEDGAFTSIGTTAATVPDGEWLDIRLDWRNDGDIIMEVDDAAGADVATLTVNDETFDGDDSGFGFKSLDANAAKYFDFATMSAVGAAVTAQEAGAEGNLGEDTLTVMPSPPNGVETATNTKPTSGGKNEEADDDFRARAKDELGEGIRGTQVAIIQRLEQQPYVKHVRVIENDTSSTDGAGRPAHSFEAVVQVDSADYGKVGQVILDTKGTGYESVGGFVGTAQTVSTDLPNGQTKDITFSTPTEVQIFADIDLTKDDTYAGDDQVRDNVVRYIGGTLSSGASEDGELGPGDDVIYNQVMGAIVETQGVVDVTNLEIDTDSTPTNTGNEAIAANDIATADATDSSLDVASTDA